MFEIASLFPPLPSHERATTESKDSDLPPDHERRVFTFDNDEEALILGGNNDISHQADEGEDDEDNDIVAEQLVAIPRSPLPGHIKTTLAQFLPASVSSRIAPEGAEDSKLVGQNILQRPTSAFRARKVPSSVSAPTIQPRLSKAAALRMGMELPERKAARSEVDVAEEVFVPGTMRRAVTPPKSLSKPTLAPRQNRASALRTTEGTEKEDSSTRPATKRRESVGTSQRSAGFEGLPGFAKRPVQPPSLPKSDMVSLWEIRLLLASSVLTGRLMPSSFEIPPIQGDSRSRTKQDFPAAPEITRRLPCANCETDTAPSIFDHSRTSSRFCKDPSFFG